MWIQLKHDGYIDTATGSLFDIKNLADSETTTPNWAIRLTVSTALRGMPSVVEDGYLTAEDAQADLDEIMLDAVRVTSAVPEETESAPETGKEIV
jgi:hypothetical protein